MLTGNDEIFKLFFLFHLYKDYITGIIQYIYIQRVLKPSNLTQCTKISKMRREEETYEN